MQLFAPAKINLSLRVGPPLADGRHPLDSLVTFVDGVGDRLNFEKGQEIALSLGGPFASDLKADDPDNLVLRAARLLHGQADAKASELGGCAMHLEKALPIASGIGGGSSDAAAALKGLNLFWQLGLSEADLTRLAASLGADVPACILGKPLRMFETGETTEAVGPLAQFGIVLVNPGIACPTGAVYRRFDALGLGAKIEAIAYGDLSSQSNVLGFLKVQGNDLEIPACDLVPEIGLILNTLQQTKGLCLARMSGSGATCFGLYPTQAMAQEAARDIRNQLALPAIWIEAGQTL